MPEVIIKYNKPEILKMLKGLAKDYGFVISPAEVNSNAKDKLDDIIVPGDKSIDITELRRIFTENNIDARQLRKEAWERKR